MPNPAILYVYLDGQMHRIPVTEYPRVVRLSEPSPLLGTATEWRKEALPPGVALTRQGAIESLRQWRRRTLEARRRDLKAAELALREVS